MQAGLEQAEAGRDQTGAALSFRLTRSELCRESPWTTCREPSVVLMAVRGTSRLGRVAEQIPDAPTGSAVPL
jgi:hypothetical protein